MLILETQVLILYPPENCLHIWRHRVVPLNSGATSESHAVAISLTGHPQMAFIIKNGWDLPLPLLPVPVLHGLSGFQEHQREAVYSPAMSKVRRLHYEVSRKQGEEEQDGKRMVAIAHD